ncbi:MAG: hypothetical protein ACPGSL_09255 [Vicingaceae bacterium]
MKKIAIIILWLSYISCSTDTNKKESNLEKISPSDNHLTFNEFFNSKEQESITFMLDNFEFYIAGNSGNLGSSESYSEYLSQFKHINGEHLKVIDVNSEKHKNFIQHMRESNMANDFWIKDTSYKWLNINIHGRYWKWLKSYSKGNKLLEKYVNATEQGGAIGPFSTNMFFHKQEEFDFNKWEHRLIWMIHFVSISSQKELKNRKLL